jgi:hypothetical protein
MSNPKTVNWSSLDRDTLYQHFYALNRRVVGKKITPDRIQRIISSHIKKIAPIRVKRVSNTTNKPGYIYMGGMYYSGQDKKLQPSIEVNFHYNLLDEHVYLTDYRWKRMSVRFADIVLHEIIHMRQFRARNFKSIPGYQSNAASASERKEQEYYGDRDEMGAFAFNIAQEMIDRFDYDPVAIKKYMDTNNATRHKNSWWYSYLKHFNFNHDHKIIRRMKHKIMRQLENAYIGKPFKTTDWLTY